ncbi:DNA-binding MarR family transcriptional regulator [Thermocatellispora tengchongensis]|uniref:DNA-binding MarR family transcriptional regulator n=1 Tax=Thermocatellispora tengchongensis TaxID=1073253 RepID=A0A840P681_9ACTN|nr:MarR family transcriptional regulator [Thermocatellispora tengchongensis]MBB5136844.1 DNA-binding MarR family transcriptional regulator [Thermocatellispora tengchongensis]
MNEAVNEAWNGREHPVVALLLFLEARGRSRAQIDRMQAAMGLPVTPLDNLTLVAVSAAAPMTVGDVASRLSVDLPRASRQIARLHRMGLVVREPDPRDRRSIRIRPTPEGEAARTRWRGVWLSDYVKAVGDWPADDIASFGAHLQALQASLMRQPGFTSPIFDAPAATPSPAADPRSPIDRFQDVVAGFVQWAATTVTSPHYIRTILARAESPVPRLATTVLREIAARGPIDITDLAHALNLDGSVASRQCTELATHRLVQRHQHPQDGRRSVLTATFAGERLLSAIDLAQSEPVHAALRTWDAETLNECLTYVARFLKNLTR